MVNCNAKDTPASSIALGSDLSGPPFQHNFSYPLAVGMLMYLASNSCPDISFAVHQCACFNHAPKALHKEAILHICWYLKGALFMGWWQLTCQLSLISFSSRGRVTYHSYVRGCDKVMRPQDTIHDLVRRYPEINSTTSNYTTSASNSNISFLTSIFFCQFSFISFLTSVFFCRFPSVRRRLM